MAKQKPRRKSSENRNTTGTKRWQRGNKYTPGELFMAGCGALILIMIAGIVITSLLGG